MSLFQPDLTVQPQAAQVGVADNTNLLNAVKIGTDAIVQTVSSSQLNDLESQFNDIKQARMTGGDKGLLLTQARVALNTFKSNLPTLGSEADKKFQAAFGGGGGSGAGGGLFGESPEEKGMNAAKQKIAEYSTLYNVSPSVAQERMALSQASEQIGAQAEIDKYIEGKVDKTTEISHQFSLNAGSTKVFDTMNRLLETKGSLQAGDVAGFNRAIQQEAIKMKAKIRQQSFLDDGSLAISQTALNRRLTEVEGWATNMNSMVGDFAKSKIDAAVLKDMTNESALAFTKAFPVVAAASQVSPQLGSQVFDMITTPDETRRRWISENPQIKTLMENSQIYSTNLSEGISKITLTDRQSEQLSANEAQTVGVSLLNGKDAAVQYVWESVAASTEAASKLKQVAYWSPRVIETILKPGFSYMLKQEPEKYTTVVDAQIAGNITAFQSSYALLHGRMPDSVGIVTKTSDMGRVSLQVNTPDGLGGPIEGAMNQAIVNNLYKVLKANPQYLAKKGEAVGNPEITAEQYLSIILSTSPQTVPQTSTMQTFEKNQPAPTQKPAKSTNPFQGLPYVGQEVNGYTFKGGDPQQQSNWEPVGKDSPKGSVSRSNRKLDPVPTTQDRTVALGRITSGQATLDDLRYEEQGSAPSYSTEE